MSCSVRKIPVCVHVVPLPVAVQYVGLCAECSANRYADPGKYYAKEPREATREATHDRSPLTAHYAMAMCGMRHHRRPPRGAGQRRTEGKSKKEIKEGGHSLGSFQDNALCTSMNTL